MHKYAKMTPKAIFVLEVSSRSSPVPIIEVVVMLAPKLPIARPLAQPSSWRNLATTSRKLLRRLALAIVLLITIVEIFRPPFQHVLPQLNNTLQITEVGR